MWSRELIGEETALRSWGGLCPGRRSSRYKDPRRVPGRERRLGLARNVRSRVLIEEREARANVEMVEPREEFTSRFGSKFGGKPLKSMTGFEQ